VQDPPPSSSRFARQSFERIEVLILVIPVPERGKQRRPRRAHLLAPEIVVNGVLQDALKQHRQLLRRLGGVFLGQLEHRVLYDVERRILIAYSEERLLERAALDLREKSREFLMRSDCYPPGAVFQRL